MAAGIIDVLEPVEIEEQHGEHRAVVLRFDDRSGQAVREIEPIGEAGQLIVMCEVIEVLLLLEQLRLHFAPRGHIVGRERDELDAIEGQPKAGRLDLEQRSALAALAKQHRREETVWIAEPCGKSLDIEAVVHEDLRQSEPAQLRKRIADCREEGGIRINDAQSRGIREQHAVWRSFDYGPVARIAEPSAAPHAKRKKTPGHGRYGEQSQEGSDYPHESRPRKHPRTAPARRPA